VPARPVYHPAPQREPGKVPDRDIPDSHTLNRELLLQLQPRVRQLLSVHQKTLLHSARSSNTVPATVTAAFCFRLPLEQEEFVGDLHERVSISPLFGVLR